MIIHENYSRREEGRGVGVQVYQHMHFWSWDVAIITLDDQAEGEGRFEIWGREVKQIANVLPGVPIRGRYGVSRLNVTPRMVTFSPSLVDESNAPLAETFLIKKDHLRIARYRERCNTQGAPYNVLVQAALLRLCTHFPLITISSTEPAWAWREATLLCLRMFEQRTIPVSLLVQQHLDGDDFNPADGIGQ